MGMSNFKLRKRPFISSTGDEMRLMKIEEDEPRIP